MGDSVIVSKKYISRIEWDQDEMIVIAVLQKDADKSIVQSSSSGFATPVSLVNKNIDLSGPFYPNPVVSFLHFDSKAKKQFEKAELFNIFGNRVRNSDLRIPIDMQSLAPGYYFLVFHDEDGNRYSSKVVKTSN